jgi:hypothetical protein
LTGIGSTLSSAARSVGTRVGGVGSVPLLLGASAVQLLIAAVIAATSTHNHLVWYSGGDATEYWTTSWSLSHGLIPQSLIGYGVPLAYAWLPPLSGVTLLSGLPVIVALQGVGLVVLAMLLVFAIGDLMFGRRYAWLAVWLWIAAPLLLLWGFSPTYASQFRDLFLAPHWYGLTNMADMPSLVAVLATAWAGLRTYEGRRIEDGVLTGLLLGVALAIKPSNGFFVPALAVLIVASRNWRVMVATALAGVPALVTLALWKDKGRGFLPISSSTAPVHEAAGSAPVLAVGGNYLHFDSAHLGMMLHDLSEVFWSLRLLEFLFFAGLVGALRRSWVKGAFLGVWFIGFVLVKGSSNLTSVSSFSFYRLVEPGLPAFAFLAASIVFLVPRRGRGFTHVGAPKRLAGAWRTVAAAAVVFGLIPLVVIAVLPASSSAQYVRDNALVNDAPLSNTLAATATVSGARVVLDWHRVDTSSTSAYYVVFRSDNATTCTYPGEGAKECELMMAPIAYTRRTSYVDRPGPGRHWYRIGLDANYRDRLDGSDLMLVGPVTAAGG